MPILVPNYCRGQDTQCLCHAVGFTQENVLKNCVKKENGTGSQGIKALYGSATKPRNMFNMAISDVEETCLKRFALRVNRPIVPNFERDVHQRGSWSSTDLMQWAAKHKAKENQSLQHPTLNFINKTHKTHKTHSVVRT